MWCSIVSFYFITRRYAVHSLALLDGTIDKIPNTAGTIAYLQSLYDSVCTNDSVLFP